MTTELKEMPSIAWHGNQAFNDDQNGLSLFVSPSKDLAAKAGTQVDSWFAYAYLESSRGMMPLLAHFMHLELPESGSLIQTMYSLLDISGSIRGKSVKGKVIIEMVGTWK